MESVPRIRSVLPGLQRDFHTRTTTAFEDRAHASHNESGRRFSKALALQRLLTSLLIRHAVARPDHK
jgi:hypothetical protein